MSISMRPGEIISREKTLDFFEQVGTAVSASEIPSLLEQAVGDARAGEVQGTTIRVLESCVLLAENVPGSFKRFDVYRKVTYRLPSETEFAEKVVALR